MAEDAGEDLGTWSGIFKPLCRCISTMTTVMGNRIQ